MEDDNIMMRRTIKDFFLQIDDVSNSQCKVSMPSI